MNVDIVMPKMGESIQEGTILQWLKKEGEKVERDEIILEISTDKVDTEVPSPDSGVLTQIIAQENDVVEVGNVIAKLDTEASEGTTASAPVAAPTPAPAPAPIAAQAQEAVPAPQGGGDTTEVVMPKMGESIQEGTILQWLKKEGDAIERDEILLEISTDKVDTEVPSPVAGTLSKIIAQENDVVEVGNVIALISSGSGGAGATPAPAAAPAPTVAPAPTAAPTPAPVAVPAPALAPSVNGTTPPQRTSGKRFYSPLVRTIAADKGLSLEELDTITGTGIDNRVTKDDLQKYLDSRGSAPYPVVAPVATPAPTVASAPTAAPAKAAPSAPAKVATPAVLSEEQIYKKYGQNIEIQPMDKMRQLIANHMVESKHTSPHVTSVGEADITDIVKLRAKNKESFLQREGIKLTYTPFFARAIIEAIRQFPGVNVSVEDKRIIKHKNINLSFATALDDGNLIVPVIHKSDELNVTGLARRINDLALRARTKKISPDEVAGGTVTLTNVGTFGTLFGTPIINQPQTAIIGTGAIQKRPVVKEVAGNDIIVARHMVYLSITYDHRVIDGMLAGQCLAAICKSLENMNENTVQF